MKLYIVFEFNDRGAHEWLATTNETDAKELVDNAPEGQGRYAIPVDEHLVKAPE